MKAACFCHPPSASFIHKQQISAQLKRESDGFALTGIQTFLEQWNRCHIRDFNNVDPGCRTECFTPRSFVTRSRYFRLDSYRYGSFTIQRPQQVELSNPRQSNQGTGVRNDNHARSSRSWSSTDISACNSSGDSVK